MGSQLLATSYTTIVEIVGKITMNKRANSNSIRIIAGQWRGRRLSVLDSEGLRPSTDRVRETLFNWLMNNVPDANCLDLFAGSGALGLEALSRGAQRVEFVEASRSVASALQQNIDVLGVSTNLAPVATQDARNYLKTTPSKPFDIVFLDPPFESDLLVQVISLINQSAWLADDALIYVEQAKKSAAVAVPPSWKPHREGKTNHSRYSLYRYQA